MRKTKKAGLIFIFLLILYSLLRVIFYLSYFNKPDLSLADFGKAMYWGCRTDIAGLFYLNVFFFLYFFLFGELLFPKRQKIIAIGLLKHSFFGH
jgi:hypothetical protein